MPKIFLTFLALFLSQISIAQCAGDDTGVLTVCDIPNPSSQTINLFSVLGGSPLAGGTWSDDELSGGLNKTTGILNVQKIRNSGKYTYTYTVPNTSGCADHTGTVEITVGNYAGVPSPKGNACGDDTAHDLFSLFDGTGTNVSPQFNGTWVNLTNGLGVSGNFFNAGIENLKIPKTYTFSYTVNEVKECPESSITTELTVYPPAKEGTPIPINICSNEDFSIYKNINLFDQLIGEDEGGRWYDDNNTGELTFLTDSTINIENIYNNFGAGSYSFRYEVFPSNPICTKKTAIVVVTIEEYIDYSNISFDVKPEKRCIDEVPTTAFTATLTQKPVLMPDGIYLVTYSITGQPSTQTTVTFANGVATFNIPNSVFNFPNNYTINISEVISVNALHICLNNFVNQSDTVVIHPLPTLEDATLKINDVCQNHDAIVQIKSPQLLTDGDYTLLYNLTGANIANNQLIVIHVTAGTTTFIIPKNLLPNAGDTELVITNITNILTGCSKPENVLVPFKVKPLPQVPNLAVSIDDICKDTPAQVKISGLDTLQNVSLFYNLSGANNSSNNLILLNVTTGTATFTIPKNLLTNTGVTTIILTQLINAENSCEVDLSNIIDTFTIFPIPDLPIVSDQIFCEADNATVASLKPQGSQYLWYDSEVNPTPLAPTADLKTGNYYVSNHNSSSGCTSQRVKVPVLIDRIDTPTLDKDGEKFCGINHPTIQDLSIRTDVPNTIAWYDALVGGNLFSATTLLQDGYTYYGFNTNSAYGCKSKNALAVTVSLTDCDVPADFFIPDGFSPNGDGINDVFHIPSIEFVYPNYTIQIYNRYGNLLFEGNKDSNWDGKNSTSTNLIDAVAPNGVYFYVINFNKHNTPAKQGRLYLNR